MKRPMNAIHSNRLRGVSAIVLCCMILTTLNARIQVASASEKPGIAFVPSFAQLNVNDTLSLYCFMTNFQDLFTFQVAFEYNGSVLNMTSVAYPDFFVFQGYQFYSQPTPFAATAAGDIVNHLNFTVVGATIIQAQDPQIMVDNATLFEANFTVIGTGTTTISFASMSSPVFAKGGGRHYTSACNFLQAQGGGKEKTTDFVGQGCTVIVGVSNAAPIANFKVSTTPVDNRTTLVLNKNPPNGISTWVVAYQGLPVYMNASDSYAPTGEITQYIWDFGDGNTTVVNATSPNASFISHVYATIGVFDANLTVVASGVGESGGLQSQAAKITILVGYALGYYDWTWFIYTVLGIIAAVIVLVAARSALRRVHIRRAKQKQKMLVAGTLGQPGAETQTN